MFLTEVGLLAVGWQAGGDDNERHKDAKDETREQRLMRREANCPPMLALACGHTPFRCGFAWPIVLHAQTRPSLHRRGFVV